MATSPQTHLKCDLEGKLHPEGKLYSCAISMCVCELGTGR